MNKSTAIVLIIGVGLFLLVISLKVAYDDASDNCQTSEGYYIFKTYNLLSYKCEIVTIPNHIHYAMLGVNGTVDDIIGYHIGKVIHFAKENNVTTLTLEGNKEFQVINDALDNKTGEIVKINEIRQNFTCNLKYVELVNGTKYFGQTADAMLLDPKSFGLEPERNLYASNEIDMQIYRFGFDTQIDDKACLESKIVYEVVTN